MAETYKHDVVIDRDSVKLKYEAKSDDELETPGRLKEKR